MAPAKSYRDQKIDFVSNLSGGSLLEINLVTLVAPAAVFLWSTLQNRRSYFTPYGPVALVTDFLLNVGAILFAMTLYSSAPVLLLVLLISPALPISLLPLAFSRVSGKTSKRATTSSASTTQQAVSAASSTGSKSATTPIQPFLTSYRGGMLIITCLAILAVDFPVFPRRFAKVENWGTSLMDLGVGSFVFSAGVVSARAIIKARLSASSSSSLGAVPSADSTKSISSRFLAAFRHSIPLFALGFIRLLSVKNLDYAEHVTEYGVHWNFFFTLALIPPFVELADLLIAQIGRSSPSSSSCSSSSSPTYGDTHRYWTAYEILSFLTALVYEIILDNTSLTRYILISPRLPTSPLLAKNREGVFSFVGYLSIFLAGRGTGLVILSPTTTASNNNNSNNNRPAVSPKSGKAIATLERSTRDRWRLLRKLATRSLIWAIIYICATNYALANLSVSRRLANLPYVVWVVTFNNAQILLFGLIETMTFPVTTPTTTPTTTALHANNNTSSSTPSPPQSTTPSTTNTSKILTAFNSNGLLIFLVANLLTGLVNLTTDTLGMRDWQAMVVLMVYAVAVTGFAVGLHAWGVNIKL